jgi:release factor glutamine methyltransferase
VAPHGTLGIAAQELLRGCTLPAGESRALLCHILGLARERLIAHPETTVGAADRGRFEQAVAQRLGGAPLAYLVGTQEFYGHCFLVTPAVLVPRPDTEVLVDAALALLEGRQAARVLELGTGSGCIALALSLARPDLLVLATDRSWPALQIARENQRRLGARMQLLAADWYAPLAGSFDLIISNPPYIAVGDAHLGGLSHEPQGALTGGQDGLQDLRRIVAGAPQQLAPEGRLLLEHGYDQGAAVRLLLRQSGFCGVRTLQDLAGHERVCVGRLGSA